MLLFTSGLIRVRGESESSRRLRTWNLRLKNHTSGAGARSSHTTTRLINHSLKEGREQLLHGVAKLRIWVQMGSKCWLENWERELVWLEWKSVTLENTKESRCGEARKRILN
jgi:hypothetical protein